MFILGIIIGFSVACVFTTIALEIKTRAVELYHKIREHI